MKTIEFKRLLNDDKQFGYKKGDIVVVDTNYDWDPDKVICVGKLQVRNDHSFYRESLEDVDEQELADLIPVKP